MKTLITLILLVFISKIVYAQTIVIGNGASIYVPSGVDICAGLYGNISGNIYGEGTQCLQTPVPVELTSFTAKSNGTEVILGWITATELNNYGFEIERTNKKLDWQRIGFVEGHGNSNSTKSYSFTDKKPFGGSKFNYRLKQIDTDGQFEYSDVIEVEIIPNEFALFQNYPNPFNPFTKIRFQLPQESKVIIKLYDILGAEVMTLVNEEKEAGVYEVDFSAQQLPSGTYVFRMVANEFIETKKMMLMK